MSYIIHQFSEWLDKTKNYKKNEKTAPYRVLKSYFAVAEKYGVNEVTQERMQKYAFNELYENNFQPNFAQMKNGGNNVSAYSIFALKYHPSWGNKVVLTDKVMKILETCLNKNCQVWTIKENYRLGNDIQSKVLAFAFGLAAEIERQLISERTKSSLANIKANGKKLGRPFNAEIKKLKLAKNQKQIQKLLAQGISKSKIAKIFGVERATLRKYLLRLSAQA